MSSNHDTPPGFRTGKELLEAQQADAIRYCEECGDWLPHDSDEQGAFDCRGCSE